MSRTISERVIAPVAIGAIALATVLAAVGTWAGHDEQGSREFLVICAVIAVAAAIVFGWVVPRGLQREAAGATALTLSILGLVAVLAFWSGLTPILAGGGALLGWAGRDADRGRAMSRAAIGIGAVALDRLPRDLSRRHVRLSRRLSGGRSRSRPAAPRFRIEASTISIGCRAGSGLPARRSAVATWTRQPGVGARVHLGAGGQDVRRLAVAELAGPPRVG